MLPAHDTAAALSAHRRARMRLPGLSHRILDEEEAAPIEEIPGRREPVAGLVKGDELRIVEGDRAGQVVTFAKWSGISASGARILRVVYADGTGGATCAHLVERV